MKAVLIYSGGMDSTVLLYYLLNEGHEVRCLSFDYGQRHRKDLDSARDICQGLDVEHLIISMEGMRSLFGDSSLTDLSSDVSEEHYEDRNMKQTIIPNRNMIMLSMGAAWAISSKSDALVYGAHRGDHTIYPDCCHGFIRSFGNTLTFCDWNPPSIEVPFQFWDKGEICELGIKLEVPFEKTWTCYEEEEKACGKCVSCQERLEAFKENGIKDPLLYREE